jgi:hypothetical protein
LLLETGNAKQGINESSVEKSWKILFSSAFKIEWFSTVHREFYFAEGKNTTIHFLIELFYFIRIS